MLSSAIAIAASGCGGGGSRPSPVIAPTPTAGTAAPAKITGTAYTKITIYEAENSRGLKIPLPSAEITCGDATAQTDSSGNYSILEARSGDVECSIAKKGFVSASFALQLAPNDSVNATDTVLLPSEMGGISIESAVPGAPFALDGAELPDLVAGVTVRGLATGDHIISAASEDYEESASITVNVSSGKTASAVLELTLKTISLDIFSEKYTIEAGAEAAFAARCTYYDNATELCTDKVTWDSSDPDVGIITDTGVFTAKAPGETKISSTRLQSRITHPGITVKVVCPDDTSWVDGECAADTLAGIVVSPATMELEKGGAARPEAVCTWTIAGEAPCPEINWISSDESVAVVDAAGSITAISAGAAEISATSGGIAGNAVTVTVKETQYPDLTCDGTGGFCLDVSGVTGNGGDITVEVSVSNAPAAGLGTGFVTLEWDSSALTYASSEAGDGINGVGDAGTEGKFVFVFAASTPIKTDTQLFTVTFTAAGAEETPTEIKIDQSRKSTNFTDFGLNLISQSGITFRDGYAGM